MVTYCVPLDDTPHLPGDMHQLCVPAQDSWSPWLSYDTLKLSVLASCNNCSHNPCINTLKDHVSLYDECKSISG